MSDTAVESMGAPEVYSSQLQPASDDPQTQPDYLQPQHEPSLPGILQPEEPPPPYPTVNPDMYPPVAAGPYPPNEAPYPPATAGPYPPNEAPYPPAAAGPYPPNEAPYPPLKPGDIPSHQGMEGGESAVCADEAPLTSSAFEDKTIRRAFVRKVFSILFLQLLFTFSVVCVFTFSSVVKEVVQEDIWAYVSSFIIFVVVAVTLSLCPSLSRRHPWNLVALFVVTASLSYMVGTIASYHDTAAVVITMGATLAISLAIIAFSIQTRYDFTVCYGLLLILVVDLVMFGFFCTFYYTHVAQIAYGTLGALLFSLFLMADIQLMMGSMSYRVSPEDYVTAALTIYLDIVIIFLYLLGTRK